MEKEEIVTLKRKPRIQFAPPPLTEKIAMGPIADKCFTLAALGSVFGILYLGIRLWLIRNGFLNAPLTYAQLRETHLYLQLFFFFGLSIMGFAVQSAPRFLSFEQPIPSAVRFSPVALLLTAWLSLFFAGTGIETRLLTSGGFLIIFVFIARHIILQKRFVPPLLFLIISLCAFTVGPFLPISDSANAILFFWVAIGGPLLGFSQLFIGNLLGGRGLGKWEMVTILLLFVASIAGPFLGFYVLPLILLVFYVSRTRFISLRPESWKRGKASSIRIAFTSGFLWAIVGSAVYALFPDRSDAALHIWATGWGTSILVGMTSHIIGFLSGHESPRRLLNAALLVWQFVPLERGLGYMLGLPLWLGYFTALASMFTLFSWIYILCRAEIRILVRQWYVTPEEPMVQEA